jgi:lipoprotein-anchoring transpeptidase ErfK/SrfK
MRWLLALCCLCFASFAAAELTVTVIRTPIPKAAPVAPVATPGPAKPGVATPLPAKPIASAPVAPPLPATATLQMLPPAGARPLATPALPLPGGPSRPLDAVLIDKILVLKSAHRLELMSRGEPVKAYRVSLGKQPRGPKLIEGDRRTPEGFYWVDWRKTSDRFNLALHVSYPNNVDSARAQKEGVNPGGMIMIHGTPISDEYPEWYFGSLDWTDGCIAMNNADMREVWSLVKDGTMIEIRP